MIGPPGVAVVDTKHWAGSVEVSGERLWCGDDDRHESVEDLLRLVTAVEELLVDVGRGTDGQPVGLSAVHVLPMLAFTGFSGARRPDARVARVRLAALRQFPALLAAQPTVLSAAEVAMVAEHLSQEMPPAGGEAIVPRQPGAVVGVPIRPEPLPIEAVTEPPAEADALFDVPDLAEQLASASAAPLAEWMGSCTLARRAWSVELSPARPGSVVLPAPGRAS